MQLRQKEPLGSVFRKWYCRSTKMKQGVALRRRNYTGPPCSFGHPTAHVRDGQPARRQRYRWWRQTTDASEQNNTSPL